MRIELTDEYGDCLVLTGDDAKNHIINGKHLQDYCLPCDICEKVAFYNFADQAEDLTICTKCSESSEY